MILHYRQSSIFCSSVSISALLLAGIAAQTWKLPYLIHIFPVIFANGIKIINKATE